MNTDKQPNQLPLSTAQSLLPCHMTSYMNKTLLYIINVGIN